MTKTEYKELQAILLDLIKHGGNLKGMNREYITQEMSNIYMSNGGNIKNVPDDFKQEAVNHVTIKIEVKKRLYCDKNINDKRHLTQVGFIIEKNAKKENIVFISFSKKGGEVLIKGSNIHSISITHETFDNTEGELIIKCEVVFTQDKELKGMVFWSRYEDIIKNQVYKQFMSRDKYRYKDVNLQVAKIN